MSDDKRVTADEAREAVEFLYKWASKRWTIYDERAKCCALSFISQNDPAGYRENVMSDRKPWHDAPLCHACKTGPMTPVSDHPTHGEPGNLRCCACGVRETTTQPVRIAQAWWSAGAYVGTQRAEEFYGK